MNTRGPTRHLVGLLANGGRPVRDGVLLNRTVDVGIVTSVDFRRLNRPALGFVDTYAEAGTN